MASAPTSAALTQTPLPESATLLLVSRGKVRDLYEVADGADAYLLFVATDRISAFDVVLNNVCACKMFADCADMERFPVQLRIMRRA
ncbi:hypothetical protein DFH11DRAFT_1196994 [Phellopilus nigrolimitatus]|nr:hypothetical protein DFH11DRAFT_1196994 [Phellopilus nigrolimitatus]